MRSRIGGWGLMDIDAHGVVYHYRCDVHRPPHVPLRESPREARLDMVAHFVKMQHDQPWSPCRLNLCELVFEYRDMTT